MGFKTRERAHCLPRLAERAKARRGAARQETRGNCVRVLQVSVSGRTTYEESVMGMLTPVSTRSG